ncbi:MAG TPA: response regulator [Gammaproteobacteria bacterium]|nr:response regulator [Gammaproteobacteria bacterium]
MVEPRGAAVGQRVLLVEDDATFSAVLARALRNRGYEVECVASFRDAVAAAVVRQPDAAIVDLKLGQESGLALVPALLRECPGMRIVVLTGYASIATAVQAIKSGAADYLTKPAEVADILAALSGSAAATGSGIAADPLTVRRLQWEHIQRVLAEQQGNISATARVLGMHRRTLQRKLGKRPVSK